MDTTLPDPRRARLSPRWTLLTTHPTFSPASSPFDCFSLYFRLLSRDPDNPRRPTRERTDQASRPRYEHPPRMRRSLRGRALRPRRRERDSDGLPLRPPVDAGCHAHQLPGLCAFERSTPDPPGPERSHGRLVVYGPRQLGSVTPDGAQSPGTRSSEPRRERFALDGLVSAVLICGFERFGLRSTDVLVRRRSPR